MPLVEPLSHKKLRIVESRHENCPGGGGVRIVRLVIRVIGIATNAAATWMSGKAPRENHGRA